MRLTDEQASENQMGDAARRIMEEDNAPLSVDAARGFRVTLGRYFDTFAQSHRPDPRRQLPSAAASLLSDIRWLESHARMIQESDDAEDRDFQIRRQLQTAMATATSAIKKAEAGETADCKLRMSRAVLETLKAKTLSDQRPPALSAAPYVAPPPGQRVVVAGVTTYPRAEPAPVDSAALVRRLPTAGAGGMPAAAYRTDPDDRPEPAPVDEAALLRRLPTAGAGRTRRGAAVGGAPVPELKAAATQDGAAFVNGSDRARAHVRNAPPTPTTSDGPAFAAQLADGRAPAPVAYGRAADALVATVSGEIRRLPARFAIVEVGHVITSHVPTTWARRAGYPEGAQERDYSRDAGEKLKVASIAGKLVPEFMVNTNPDALNGPPVVDTAGIVLGGNGRTMALTLAYADNRAGAYRALLVERAELFGFKRSALDAFASPLLVRCCFVAPGERADLSRRLNEGQTQEKRAAVDAASMARRLSPATLATLGRDNAADATIRAFLRTPGARDFVAGLTADGVIERRTSSRYLTPDGNLTDDGITLAERILTAWAVPDVATVEAIGETRRDAIARVVPAMASAAGAGHDLAGLVRDAAEQVREADARSSSPAALANQGGLFGGRDVQPAALALATALHSRPRSFVAAVRDASREAVAHPAAQSDMFGPPATIDQLTTRAVAAQKEAQ